MSSEKRDDRQQEGEEVEHYDDRFINRVFVGSLVAVVVLVVGVVAGYFLLQRKPSAPATQVTAMSAPVVPDRGSVELPSVTFAEVGEAAGIRFVHRNGAYGDKLLPETMGGGCAFIDLDGDQDPDLLFVNGTDWPWKAAGSGKGPTAAMYRNDGAGRFVDVTAGSGLDVPLYGMGVAVGDYDNDGLPDVFLTGVGPNRLLRNLGGMRFEDATTAAGVAGDGKEWSTSAAWVDVDNDGDLDLFVANYVRWSREIDFEVNYRLTGIGRAYGPPMNFAGTFPYLYRNEGGGRFRDISEEAGVQVKNASTGVPAAKSLGVAPVDFDGDGWMDLVVANDTVQNFVFRNTGKGGFREVGALSGVAFDSYGNTRGAMGIDTGDFRNDGTLGIGIGNFANEMTALYVSSGRDRSMFTDEAIAEGVGPVSRLPLKFGLFFFDYDLDGYLDLLTANGHLEEEIRQVQQSQEYRQSAQLFWNAGAHRATGGFLPVPAEKAGRDLFRPIVGRGSAYADMDNDGDLDVVLTQSGGKPLLLRNEQMLRHAWLRLKLVGTKSNRDAIGAWVIVKANGREFRRQVMAARSYLSQSELPVTVGLGKGTRPESVEVVWPGGKRQRVNQYELNRLTEVREE